MISADALHHATTPNGLPSNLTDIGGSEPPLLPMTPDRVRARGLRGRGSRSSAVTRTRVRMRSEALSEGLRAARRDRGWTQQEVARKVGITVRSVSGWECGKTIPHLETLVALARALGQEPQRFISTAQAVTAQRRAERLELVSARIQGALSEVVEQLRVGS